VAEAVGVDPSSVFVAKAGELAAELQDCIEAVKAEFLNDPWLVRRLPALLRSAGFQLRVRAATTSSLVHRFCELHRPEPG
jgi:hypothetical protein